MSKNAQRSNSKASVRQTAGQGGAAAAARAYAPAQHYDGPDISVIVPVYNLENEVERCLKSILAQKTERLEIIVVNDCSKDRTEEIVRRFADAHREIKLISFSENKGVAAARNAALEAATGEFIHFCDGDDAVPPGAYRELLYAARNGEADLVTGNYSRMYPDEGNTVRQFSHYTAPTGRGRCFESGNTMLWNKLYRRSVIENNNIRFNEKLKYYEDFLFFSQMLLACGEIGYTDDSVYIYTEPLFRDFQRSIRYASMDCARGLDVSWRTLAEQINAEREKKKTDTGKRRKDGEEFPDDTDDWRRAYRWNLEWYFTYSWKMIQDPDTRRRAFDTLRALLIRMNAETRFGRWTGEEGENEFARLFRIDFASFCTIDYEDYLLRLAFDENIRPRRADPLPRMRRLSEKEKDALYAENAEKLLSELCAVYGMPLSDMKVWRENYWNLLDSILNDCWRPITDRETKERLYVKLQETVRRFYDENVICAIPNPDVLRRFKQIFCTDHATFQTLTFSRYMIVGSDKPFAVLPQGSANPPQIMRENVYVQSDPALVFLTACRNGQVGMRTILRAVKEWMSFKRRRRKNK
jgi:glycosyltransferase involved in cell wall biosynthesis